MKSWPGMSGDIRPRQEIRRFWGRAVTNRAAGPLWMTWSGRWTRGALPCRLLTSRRPDTDVKLRPGGEDPDAGEDVHGRCEYHDRRERVDGGRADAPPAHAHAEGGVRVAAHGHLGDEQEEAAERHEHHRGVDRDRHRAKVVVEQHEADAGAEQGGDDRGAVDGPVAPHPPEGAAG